MTVEKPKPKLLLRPITTGADSAMNQSQFLAIKCNSLKAREKSRVHGAIGFDFASHWLKNWRESFQPITKRSNRNHVITFDSHLQTALSSLVIAYFWNGCNHQGLHSCARIVALLFTESRINNINDSINRQRCLRNICSQNNLNGKQSNPLSWWQEQYPANITQEMQGKKSKHLKCQRLRRIVKLWN